MESGSGSGSGSGKDKGKGTENENGGESSVGFRCLALLPTRPSPRVLLYCACTCTVPTERHIPTVHTNRSITFRIIGAPSKISLSHLYGTSSQACPSSVHKWWPQLGSSIPLLLPPSQPSQGNRMRPKEKKILMIQFESPHSLFQICISSSLCRPLSPQPPIPMLRTVRGPFLVLIR